MSCTCTDTTIDKHINVCLPKKRAVYASNKEHIRKLQRDWKNKNADKVKASRRRLYNSNIEASRKYYREYARKTKEVNLEKRRDASRKAYWKNPERKRKLSREVNARLKVDAVNRYGKQCLCCGEKQLEFLTIDHINNDGRRDVTKTGKRICGLGFYQRLKSQGWPSGYQVLCYNCNCTKGFFRKCPHDFREELNESMAA